VAGPRNVPVIPVSNLENVEKALQGQDVTYQMPYVAVSPGSVEQNTSSYNASVSRRYGLRSGISEDRSTYTFAKLFPVVATYQVMVVTDDVLTMMRMVDRWMSNEIWGFVLSYEDIKIKVKITADKNFAVPQRQPNSAGSDQFRQQTSLRAETYSGSLWQVPSIYRTEIDYALATGDMTAVEAKGLKVENFLSVITDAPSHQPQA
jgi:hypothetical protein